MTETLHGALESSQRLGMVGQRPIEEVIAHAGAFVDALGETAGLVVDLGSGGGVPGLVIAVARPDLQVLLVDRRAARADHLRRLVRRLGLEVRVSVTCADANRLDLQPLADVVVARSFGPPRTTGRIAARLLRNGGMLVVSEPPGANGERWAVLPELELTSSADPRVAVLRRVPRGTDSGLMS